MINMWTRSQILEQISIVCRDVQRISKTFEEVFKYFCTNNSPYAMDYVASLKTIVGLGYTAVLAEDLVILSYQKKMEIFLRYCDFRKNEHHIHELSKVIAEMLDLAFSAFRASNYPPYYQNFVITLSNMLNRIDVFLSDSNSECQKHLQSLQKGFSYGKSV